MFDALSSRLSMSESAFSIYVQMINMWKEINTFSNRVMALHLKHRQSIFRWVYYPNYKCQPIRSLPSLLSLWARPLLSDLECTRSWLRANMSEHLFLDLLSLCFDQWLLSDPYRNYRLKSLNAISLNAISICSSPKKVKWTQHKLRRLVYRRSNQSI